ncbi:hypothetical protein OG252_02460 [Streptomyces sp. NBC_01352]|nr:MULTISPECIES: hypothetical protein [unclassified Streptomyces]MCX4706573.1 hypothetical protein [Streptomyces sp. NBC_01373]
MALTLGTETADASRLDVSLMGSLPDVDATARAGAGARFLFATVV